MYAHLGIERSRNRDEGNENRIKMVISEPTLCTPILMVPGQYSEAKNLFNISPVCLGKYQYG